MVLTTHLMEEAERLCDRVAIIEHGRVLDVDTPAGLVERYCPERTVVVATDAAEADARFRALARVTTVRRFGTRYQIQGRGDPLITDVIHAVSAHGMAVTEFRTVRPTLEDVFLTVTGRSIRD